MKAIHSKQEDQNRQHRESCFQQVNRKHSDKSQPSVIPGVAIFPSKVQFVWRGGISIQVDRPLLQGSGFSSTCLLTPPVGQSTGWAVAAQVKRIWVWGEFGLHIDVCTHTISSIPLCLCRRLNVNGEAS